MGRPERPLDPEAGPVQRFAHELRLLRRGFGSPSYRTMSERTRVSVTALSRAASGERLPSAAVVRAYARACGADPDVWEQRLNAVARQADARREDGAGAPYQGLARFESADRALFFGRDRLADEALRMVREHRFVVLVGASGSGKSSLLRAGLLPRLERFAQDQGCDCELTFLTPGCRPAADYGRLLVPRREGPERLVVVDQLEEIFTLCRDRADRWRFVDQLLAARDPASRLRVVVAVGAGFHGRCAEHPGLAEELDGHTLTVGPMTRAELREAVVGPATSAGLRVERELTARLVEEATDQPCALPMLSHALRETWRRRRSGVLTLQAYEETGGVRGAIARAAEEVYGSLTPEQTGTARRVLLALITPGYDGEYTRRPLARAALREWPDPEVPVVLERLAAARLVTLDGQHAELAHDALVTHWPRLQGWIEESRERMRRHRDLAEAARDWREHGRDPGSLYRGARLAVADALFGRDRGDHDLTAGERAFLSASRVAQTMEGWTSDRTRGRVRGLVLALSLALMGTLTVSHIAWQESRVVERQRGLAAARQAAALAGRQRVTDPRVRALLSVAAWRLSQIPESRGALMDAFGSAESDVFAMEGLREEEGAGAVAAAGRAATSRSAVPARQFLVDSGRALLVASAGTWSTWDVVDRRRTGTGRFTSAESAAHVTAASPDGRTLALTDPRTGDTSLWRRAPDGSTSERPIVGRFVRFGVDGASYVMANGSRVLLRSLEDDRVLFATEEIEPAPADANDPDPSGAPADPTTANSPMDTPTSHPAPGARLVALCRAGRPLLLWDTLRHRTRPGDWRAPAASPAYCSLAFSPDGTRLAVPTPTGTRIWDTVTGRRLADLAHGRAEHLAFTPDGRFLAAVGGGPELTVWRVASPAAPVLRHPLTDGPVTALAWDRTTPTLRYLTGGAVHTLDLTTPLITPWYDIPLDDVLLSSDGALLATTEGDRFHLYDTESGRPLATLTAPATGGPPLMSFTPDGGTFAYGTGGPRSSVVVRDLRDRRTRAVLTPPAGTDVRAIALTPEGDALRLTRTTADGTLGTELWDIARRVRTGVGRGSDGPGAGPVPETMAHEEHTTYPERTAHAERAASPSPTALSPDGRHQATGNAYGEVTVWTAGRRPGTLVPAPADAPACLTCSRVTALAFSEDGATLAIGYGSGDVRVWDVDARLPLGGSLRTAGDAVRTLAFTPDGVTLRVGGVRAPLQSYTVDPDRIAARLCTRAGPSLSPEEWRTYLPDAPYRRVCGTRPADAPALPPT
ncbi:hypothetical protein IAG44_19050 [Streptomyces roseirectus]|uniref:HTH cro/C1-type domain-containing protein n=1 Tax=Streptomyces roseirectus TaxID=2768066 RepID=A0A7H0IST1_9ACTN|nr:hypothetical protein IAG44_19050 [Streptomyces roseirectus]